MTRSLFMENGIFQRIIGRISRGETDLAYGVPKSDQVYDLMEKIIDNGDDPNNVFNLAVDKVEKLKEKGNPGAFIVKDFDDDENSIYTTYKRLE